MFVLNVKKVLIEKLYQGENSERKQTTTKFPDHLQDAFQNHTALIQQSQTSGCLPISVHSNCETAKI